MARVLHAPVLHDENSTSAMLKTNATGGGLGKMGLTSTAKTEGRRALGNITNRAPAGGALPSAGKGGKPEGVRRALGDITNSVAPKQLGPAKQVPPAKTTAALQSKAPSGNVIQPAPVAPQQQQQPATKEASKLAAAAEAAAAIQAKAELYAMDGTERMAGKGWTQQEAERAQRLEAQLQQRLGRGGGLLDGHDWAGFAFRHSSQRVHVADAPNSIRNAVLQTGMFDGSSSDDDSLGLLHESPPRSPKTVPRYVPEYSTPDMSPTMACLPELSFAKSGSPELDFFAMLPELSFGNSPAQ